MADSLKVDWRRDFELALGRITYKKTGDVIRIVSRNPITNLFKNEAQMTPTGMILTQSVFVTTVEQKAGNIIFHSNVPGLLPEAAMHREADGIVVDRRGDPFEVVVDETGRVLAGGTLMVDREPYRLIFRHQPDSSARFGGMHEREPLWKAELRKTATGYEWIQMQRGDLSPERKTIEIGDGKISITRHGLFRRTVSATLTR